MAGNAVSLGVVAGLGLALVAQADTALTVYSSAAPGEVRAAQYRPRVGVAPDPNAGENVPGYAIVRQTREVQLQAGRSALRFTDVAALIDPTTVTFTSLTDPAARVLEQDFQFDLVSTTRMLQRFIDREVTVQLGPDRSLRGTLLAAGDDVVVRGSDGTISSLKSATELRFAELPGGLITRPTLVWDIHSPKGGAQQARVTYETGGITWWTDYNLVFRAGADANTGTVDLSAWVSVLNQSGARYDNARLKLVAGSVNRAPKPRAMSLLMRVAVADAVPPPEAGFTEQSFDEYHLYTLGRPTTLPDNSTKQIELFDAARNVPVRRVYVFANEPGDADDVPMQDPAYGTDRGTPVISRLELVNDKASGLGLPLPAGRARVSRLDPQDGSLEFIGEDVIGHTPRNEPVRLTLGQAFDVVGERRQRAFRVDTRARTMEEEIEVELRNHKDQAVEVQVRERLYRWTTADLQESSLAPQRPDARTLVFPVKVPADGKAQVRYRVRYRW